MHETAIASILFGNDPNAVLAGAGSFSYEGVTPDASGDFHEFWHFLTDSVFPGRKPEADVITISLGSQFEDWWTRGIDAMSERYGVPIVAGIGNGLSAHDSTLFPAAGSNVIGVGAIEEIQSDDLVSSLASFWRPVAGSSSCGPTDDYRAKPDIVAPGRCVAADGTGLSAYLVTPSCSSYATPIVAGAIGLLTQEVKADPNLAEAMDEGAALVMKAILLTSARKLPYWHKGAAGSEDDPFVPLDYSQGAGALDVMAAHEVLKAGRRAAGEVGPAGWDAASLPLDDTGGAIYLLDDDLKDKSIAATLVWNRHYSQSYPFARDASRDSNLSLELWAYGASGARLAAYSDSRQDNIEHVWFVAEPNERYFLLVRLSDDSLQTSSGVEPYALAWQVAAEPVIDESWYDLNGDGKVDVGDALILISNFTTADEKWQAGILGDINMDGRIDILDLAAMGRMIRRH